ncbi:MAG: sodium/proton-translocating pyrophosphatase, partial [Planctomycetales bacterium]
IIGGIAMGMQSVWAPTVIIGAATLLAFGFASGGRFDDIQFFAIGLYGVGIAAVGMLSTLGITLATDAYGPIADHAGGNAQMAKLEPIVRERTDALDSLGNTTAATGKGFAIGSAALTALALMAAYVEEVRIGFDRWAQARAPISTDHDGAGDTEVGFYKLSPQFVVQVKSETTGTGKKQKTEKSRHMWLTFPRDAQRARVEIPDWKDADYSAQKIAGAKIKNGDQVFREDGKRLFFTDTNAELTSLHAATLPDFTTYYDASLMNPKVLVGVFLGAMATFLFCAMTMKAVGRAAKGMVEEVRRQFQENPGIMEGTVDPDYAEPVRISTVAAQREMVLPSLLGLVLPLAVGFLLGVGGVLGLLVGTLTCGFCLAIFMANAGGAWDNAKKFIEAGAHGGQGTDAHKASVVGDTVGDPFKDTSGPSLNILIKLMSMVSVVAAGLTFRYSLEAMGLF